MVQPMLPPKNHQIKFFRLLLRTSLAGSVLRTLHADFPFRATGSFWALIDFIRSAADAPRAIVHSCDHRRAYVGYVFQKLNAFVVNLAPNAGIGDVAEG